MDLTLANNIEQTKLIITRLASIKEYIPEARLRIMGLISCRDFIESVGWNLTNQEFDSYYQAFVIGDRLDLFLVERTKQLEENIIRLRVSIGREIAAFLQLWVYYL